MKQLRRGNWLVNVRCQVTKEVRCEDCTRYQAEYKTWEHATEETAELGMDDWEVISVEEETP